VSDANPLAEPVGFLAQRLDELVVRLGEGRHALVLEHSTDVAHVDADGSQSRHHRAGLVHTLVDRAGDATVVLERLDRALRQGVHGVGADQVVDVQRVGVVGVLGRRRSPERPLDIRAAGRQPLPSLAGEEPAE
jgi:hypothetical protein